MKTSRAARFVTVAGAAVLAVAGWTVFGPSSGADPDPGASGTIAAPAEVLGDNETPPPVPTIAVSDDERRRSEEAATAYLGSTGLKPGAVQRLVPWFAEGGERLGMMAVVALASTGEIPDTAPALEQTKSSCEGESENPERCADYFVPTRDEPYRIAAERTGSSGEVSTVFVFMDQRGGGSKIVNVIAGTGFGS